MSYEVFQSKIKGLVSQIEGMSVKFLRDTEHNKHCAVCSDGTRFFGNPSSLRITAQWGTGHQAVFMPQ